jgi:DNA-3-methyladenine glycosylase II
MARATTLAFIVRPVPPFRLDLTAWALRRRARNLIDRWDGSTYRRVIDVGSRLTEVAVRQVGSAAEPRLVVQATPAPHTAAERHRIRATLDRLLGVRLNLSGWYRMAARDARLRPLAARFRGVKPPRFPTIFEALVNAFACQQLSLEVGLELLNRLASLCETKVRTDGEVHYAFPGAADVSTVPAAQYRAIGFSRQKVRAALALARAVVRRDLDLSSFDRENDAIVQAQLLGLRGVGRWTAEYVLLRGLGRLHVFPGDDVGAQKRLARLLGRPHPLDYAGVRRAIARWQPWAGMVYFHLLLDGLLERGVLPSTFEAASSRTR